MIAAGQAFRTAGTNDLVCVRGTLKRKIIVNHRHHTFNFVIPAACSKCHTAASSINTIRIIFHLQGNICILCRFLLICRLFGCLWFPCDLDIDTLIQRILTVICLHNSIRGLSGIYHGKPCHIICRFQIVLCFECIAAVYRASIAVCNTICFVIHHKRETVIEYRINLFNAFYVIMLFIVFIAGHGKGYLNLSPCFAAGHAYIR